jgi:hypothetical protein
MPFVISSKYFDSGSEHLFASAAMGSYRQDSNNNAYIAVKSSLVHGDTGGELAAIRFHGARVRSETKKESTTCTPRVVSFPRH